MYKGKIITSSTISTNTTIASGVWNRVEQAQAKSAGSWPIASEQYVASGLILNLDATNTSSYTGTGTTWTDLTGSYNGTLTNTTFDSTNGGSIVFNGSSSVVSTSLPKPAMPLTFDFWVNPTNTSQVGLFDTAPGSINVLRQYGIGAVEWWNGDPSLSLGWSANTWQHIVLVYMYTGSVRTIKYYRNGSLITTATGGSSSTYEWTTLRFGNINNGSAGWFSGKVSSIRIYNRELISSEANQNYLSGKTRYGL